MFVEERKQKILNIMRKKNNRITVNYLCVKLFASAATIRRDLKDLEIRQLIKRTYGGAILCNESINEDPLLFREMQNYYAKKIISNIAIKHVHDGMTIFLDSSSTVFILAENFKKFNNLKVITNSLKTTMLLSDYQNIKLLSTGGILRENSKSLIGLSAREFVSRYNADLCFMSCRGVTILNGASESNEDEYYVKKQYMQNCKKIILMFDTSKLNKDFICKLAPLNHFNEIITEDKLINKNLNKYTKG